MTEEKQMPDWEALKEEIHGTIYRTHNGGLRNIDEVVDSVMDCIRFPVRQSGDAVERVALAIGRTLYMGSEEDWDDLMRGVLRDCAKAALAAMGRAESSLVDALRFYAVTREEFAKEGKTGTEWQMRVYSDNGKVAREAINASEQRDTEMLSPLKSDSASPSRLAGEPLGLPDEGHSPAPIMGEPVPETAGQSGGEPPSPATQQPDDCREAFNEWVGQGNNWSKFGPPSWRDFLMWKAGGEHKHEWHKPDDCPFHGTPMQSYSNYVNIKTPQGKWICADACMVVELKKLWNAGVETIECCCGHGTQSSYIAVTEECRGIVEGLGYLADPKAPHCYLAKTHNATVRESSELAKVRKEKAFWLRENADLCERLFARESVDAVAILLRYGRHDASCATCHDSMHKPKPKCDCGLYDAMDKLRGKQ